MYTRLNCVRLSLRQQVVVVVFGPSQPATWSYHAADCQPTAPVRSVSLVQSVGVPYRTLTQQIFRLIVLDTSLNILTAEILTSSTSVAHCKHRRCAIQMYVGLITILWSHHGGGWNIRRMTLSSNQYKKESQDKNNTVKITSIHGRNGPWSKQLYRQQPNNLC